jgi:hypothetical protein
MKFFKIRNWRVDLDWTEVGTGIFSYFLFFALRRSLWSPPSWPHCRKSWAEPSACSTTGSAARGTSSGPTLPPAWALASRYSWEYIGNVPHLVVGPPPSINPLQRPP